MHTVTCSCDNVIPVIPEMAGKTIPCPKCGKSLDIPAPAAAPSAVLPDEETPPSLQAVTPAPKPKAPEPPPPQQKPHPAVRRKAASATSRRPAGSAGSKAAVLAAGFVGLVIVGIAVVLVVAGGKGKSGPRADRPAPPPNGGNTARDDGKAEPPDNGTAKAPENRRKVDFYTCQLNLSGIAVAYLEHKSDFVAEALDKERARRQARELRSSMRALEAERRKHVSGGPYDPAYIQPFDRLIALDNQRLSELSTRDAVRMLGRFVAGLRAGTRARVIVHRSGAPHEFNIFFDERPKELQVIMAMADLIPGQTDPLVRKDPNPDPDPDPGTRDKPKPDPDPDLDPDPGPADEDALAILVDPKLRGDLSKRDYARESFEANASGSDFELAAAVFLSKSDDEWKLAKDPALDALQTYFKEHVKPAAAGGFDKDRHLKAAMFLAGAIKGLEGKDSKAGPEVLELFAEGHLSDAAAGLGVGSSRVARAAEELGFGASEDGKVFGRRSDVVTYDMACCGGRISRGVEIAKRAGGASFSVRYAAMFYRVSHAVEEGKDLLREYSNVVGFSKSASGRAKAHLQAIGEGIANIGKCTTCTKGQVPCHDCAEKGKVDITCPECEGEGRVKLGPASDAYRWCRRCNKTGTLKGVTCKKCKGKGKLRCSECDLKGWLREPPPGSASDVFTDSPCSTCGGRGVLMKHVAHLCGECRGLGRLLIPAVDPDATLN